MPEKNPFFGATFAERKALRDGTGDADAKQVDAADTEDKAVTSAATKKLAAAKKRG